MAGYEVREGSTNLFRNNDKKDEKQPDFRGQVLVDGQLKDIALWERQDRNGGLYYGCKVSEGRQRKPKQEHAEPAMSSRPLAQSLNDEIPFAPEWR